jgi:ERCC4-type nuclease
LARQQQQDRQQQKMTPSPDHRMRIVIDSNEQQPWSFPENLVVPIKRKLPTADYALDGDLCFAIERKSLDDYVGTITSGWERFQDEMKRMEIFPARIVIVEAAFSDVIEHKYNHPSVYPWFVVSQTAELIYSGVSVLFVDNPVSAAGLAYKILEKRRKDWAEAQAIGANNSVDEPARLLN